MSEDMTSRIAELEREIERLQANWRLQRDIISDLQEQNSGMASLLLAQERRAIKAEAWAKRWKRAAKQQCGCFQEALIALDNAIGDYEQLRAGK